MRAEAVRQVLRWVRPDLVDEELEHTGHQTSEPAFLEDCLQAAMRMQATLPFLEKLESLGLTDLVDGAEAQHRRERMLLALLDEELRVSLQALESSGLPVIVLKGMDLGRRFYPSRHQRPMADVDLLVGPESMARALQVLEQDAGFRKVGPYPPGRFRVELSRAAPGESGPIVELHRALQHGDTPEWLGGIWDRSLSGAIPGLSPVARALASGDILTYLIRHCALQHLLESPIWLNDIHYLIEGSPELNWVTVWEELDRSHGKSAGWFVLTMVARHWGTAVPPDFLQELGRSLGPTRRARLESRMDPFDWFNPVARGAWWAVRSRVALRDGKLDAARYVYRFAVGRLSV